MTRFHIARTLARFGLIAIFGLASFSCVQSNDEDNAQASTPPEGTSIEDVKQQSGELAETLEGYTETQRQQAMQQIETSMSRVDRRLESFESTVDSGWDGLSDQAREQARQNIDMLKRKREQMAESYNDMQAASGAAWDKMKEGFSDAYTDINNAFDEAEKEFQDNS